MIPVHVAVARNLKNVTAMQLKTLAILLLFASLWISCSSEKNKAKQFNDNLIIYQVRLMENLEKINDLVLAGKKDSLPNQLQETHAWVKASIPEVKAIEPYVGGEVMKEKVLELLAFYDELFTNDYPEYIQLLQSDTVAEDRLKTVLMQIQFRELQARQLEREMEDAQDSFTQAMGIRMVKKEE